MKKNVFCHCLYNLILVTFSLNPCFGQDTLVAVAGTGTQGYAGAGGLATTAQLSTPTGVCHDASGNLYIAEWGNNRIRKIDAVTGIISTIVDTGGAIGYTGDNGPAINATIHYPLGVFVDASGNIYFGDSYNHCVRKVNASTGIITTIAGTGTYGYSGDNGLAVNAKLNSPGGIFVTAAGDIYITDDANNVIRKITASTGIITTVAGNGTAGDSGDNGPATQARLALLTGKCFVDAAGNIYIPEGNGCVVRKVTAATGIITTVAGKLSLAAHFSGDSGLAVNAGMWGVIGVYLDAAGNMYLSDCNNHRIRKVDAATGIIHTIAGGGTGTYDGSAGLATQKRLGYIWDIWPDTEGNLLLADYGWSSIWKLIPCVSNTVTLSGATFTALAKNAGYQWVDCNNGKAPIAGASTRGFTATSQGSYAVVVTHNGCVDTSGCFIYNPTGINEATALSGATFFPNPTTGQLNIDFIEYTENASIKLYNLLGQTVLEEHKSACHKITIDISELVNGNYVLQVIRDGNIFQSKLVKE